MITKRESEVLDLVAKGYTNAQISNTLDITIHTTKAHVAKLSGSEKGPKNPTHFRHLDRNRATPGKN